MLAELLRINHRFNGSVWLTEYSNIKGLKLLASTTNGTSGLGIWNRRRVYWSYDWKTQRFCIEPA